MLTIKGVDFLELERRLTAEERLACDTARRFVNQRVLPIIEEHYQKGTFPMELVPEMGALGFFGCNIEGYGCAGLSPLAYGLIQQELEAGDAGVRSFVSVQSSLVMHAIHAFGTEAQKQKFLPKLATGEMIGCFGLTEPDSGSNPAGMRTKAVKVSGGYLLNGSKMWITNGSVAGVAVVWARDSVSKCDGKIRGFLVEKGTPGFDATDIKNKHSFRASITSGLSFADCLVPEEALLPGTEGLKSALSCLTQARFGVAWGALGSAMACYNQAREYALSRVQFHDKPIASHQLVQAKLAWMLTEITKAQCLTHQVTRLKTEGRLRPSHVSMIKMNNTEVALKTAHLSREIHGANGISSEYPIMRHLCNLETTVTYEGTTDIHVLSLGKEITGISAF